jgi:WD40 repeat protein
MAGDVRIVRVFVSSPNDVAPERARAQAVAAKLNCEFEGLVRFETLLWEERFYTADRAFQTQISESSACDIVVSIFWTRLGTELPPDFRRMDNGRPYPSGTAYELLTALDASRHRGVPDVYVFRKTADAALPTTDIARRQQTQKQLEALEAFWSEWFKNERGQFKAAFQHFASTDEFEGQLEKLLRQWLDTHSLMHRSLAWPPEKGSPFRGLAAFEAEHAAVFFGREREIEEARSRLAAAAGRGTPFLLIIGASGAGKSSLARAGLIPRLTTPGLVSDVDLWRVARMKPSEGRSHPISSLASALFAEEALPELALGDYPNPESLADNLRRGGAAAVRPVLRGLERVADDARQHRRTDSPLRAVLLLLVDQLEELFAQAVADDERAAFSEILGQLAVSRQIWCVATLRADLYEQLLRQPALKALKETGAGLDLGPPGAAELAEIVRAPANAAGLVFGHDADKGALDGRLLADAKTADSLPLLQFTLQQLYSRRTDTVRLTHAAYDAIGGLQGAIAEEAERAVADVGPDSIARLSRLLRRLAEPARDGTTLTLRDALQAETTADPAEAVLVKALLNARILIARTDASGRPTVRLAHDAVFASWPRAAAAAQASREFYRIRAEVEQAQRRWAEHGRVKDRLIPSGVPLAEAERLVVDFGSELPAALIGYVNASRNRARSRQRLVASAAVFFFVLALAAGGMAKLAYDRNNELRGKNNDLNRAQARITQQFLTSAAEDRLRESKFDLAALLARAASPADMTQPDRETWPPALDVLQQVAQRDLLRMVVDGHAAMFSPDGTRMLTWYGLRYGAQSGWLVSRPNTRTPSTKLLDIPSGALIATLQNARPGAFSSSGKWLIIRAPDNVAKVLDARTGAEVAVLKGHGDAVTSAQFSPDESAIVTTSLDGTARLWSTTSFETTSVLSVEQPTVASFSRDGQHIMIGTDDGAVATFEVSSSRKMLEFAATDGNVQSIKFSPDAKRVLVISKDHRMRVWALETGERVFEVPGVVEAAFSPDGMQILTTTGDWTARLWDAATGKAGLVFKHETGVHDVAFSPDGKYVMTASTDAVRVWESDTGEIVAMMRGREATGEQVGGLTRFDLVEVSPNGRWVAGATGESDVRVWQCCTRVIRGHGQQANATAFSPDGKYLVAAFAGSDVAKVFGTATGMLSAELRGHEGEVLTAEFSPDGKKIVTYAKDATVRIWGARTGETIAILPGENVGQRWKFTPDGRQLWTTGPKTKTRIWNADTGALIQELDFWFQAISADNRQVAIEASDTSIDILDIGTGRKVTLDDPEMFRTERARIDFSPDGEKVLVLSGRRIHLWNTRSGASLRVIVLQLNSEHSARFSPDGRSVISTFRNEFDIWDAETGVQAGTFKEEHNTWTGDYDFSPDGNWMVTVSSDGSAHLWDAHTFRQVAAFRGPGAGIRFARFSPDSQKVATGSYDGTAQLWTVLPLSSTELADYSTIRAVRDLTDIERSRYSVPEDHKQTDWIPPAGSFNDCDRLAGFPQDPQKRTWGVAFDNIKEGAVAACRAALAKQPDEPRYMYQLARALNKQGETAEARDLLERAAARGYAAAHNNIGFYYQRGEKGFPKDAAAAISHDASAFEGGVLNCASTISGMYWRGEGVDRNRKLAIDWLRRGAATGDPYSHTRLAYLYEHGEEVEHSLDRALLHWALAERLFSEAEHRGTEPRGSSDYPRVRRMALARDLPAKDVAQIAAETLRWAPAASP